MRGWRGGRMGLTCGGGDGDGGLTLLEVECYRPLFEDRQHLLGVGGSGYYLGIRVIRRRAYSGPSRRGRGH
nr:hypothetical protein [Tanacetum cinerariifolium]